jgi:hypothetical protein
MRAAGDEIESAQDSATHAQSFDRKVAVLADDTEHLVRLNVHDPATEKA